MEYFFEDFGCAGFDNDNHAQISQQAIRPEAIVDRLVRSSKPDGKGLSNRAEEDWPDDGESLEIQDRTCIGKN